MSQGGPLSEIPSPHVAWNCGHIYLSFFMSLHTVAFGFSYSLGVGPLPKRKDPSWPCQDSLGHSSYTLHQTLPRFLGWGKWGGHTLPRATLSALPNVLNIGNHFSINLHLSATTDFGYSERGVMDPHKGATSMNISTTQRQEWPTSMVAKFMGEIILKSRKNNKGGNNSFSEYWDSYNLQRNIFLCIIEDVKSCPWLQRRLRNQQ